MASKKTKIALGAAAAVLLLAGAYFLGRYLFDEQRLLDRLDSAIERGQPDKLLELLTAPEGQAPLERKAAEAMIVYFKANEDKKKALLGRLTEEADLLKADAIPAFADDDKSAFVYLSKTEGKRWGLYDGYELKLKLYSLPVTTNFGGSAILLNGKEAGTAGAGGSVLEVGPVLPGEHTIKVVYQGKYTKLEEERTVAVFPVGGGVGTVDVPLKGEYVSVFANNSSARIFINGQDLELAVGDGQRIGPIAIDGTNKMRLEVEYPWGITRSEEEAIDGDRLEFNLPSLTETVKEGAMEAAYSFLTSWYEAFRKRDAGSLRHAYPERANDLAAHFAEMVANDEFYSGEVRRAAFDLDSFRLDQYSDTEYSVSVQAKVDYSEAYYYGAYETKPEPIEGTQYTEYQLLYENGQWLVSGWMNLDAISTDNLKVFK
jgi:hypothetical protein